MLDERKEPMDAAGESLSFSPPLNSFSFSLSPPVDCVHKRQMTNGHHQDQLFEAPPPPRPVLLSLCSPSSCWSTGGCHSLLSPICLLSSLFFLYNHDRWRFRESRGEGGGGGSLRGKEEELKMDVRSRDPAVSQESYT